jgi:hypothetical protein
MAPTRPLYSTIVIRGLSSQTASSSQSASFPSNPRSSRSTTPAGIPEAPLATSERPSTPPIDAAATSSLFWKLSISPERRVDEARLGDPLSWETYSEIRHDGPLRLTDEMTYYRVLQHFHQWRDATEIRPWGIGCTPRPEEVVRYGLMHRFLNSLGPPPPDWVCPPLVANNRRRTHRRGRRRRKRFEWPTRVVTTLRNDPSVGDVVDK